jgi:hypothetical protein
MKYNQVGIDTIRFKVSQAGFKKWLKKHEFSREKVENTPLTSKTLVGKLQKDKSIRVIKINKSYPNRLSNYIILSNAPKRHYNLEIAGLHQPTNGLTNKGTYEILAELLKKYLIESVDYAIDFIAKDHTIIDKKAIATALGSEISGTHFNSTYFCIGADYSGEEPLGSVWTRDSVLYHKAQKEASKGVIGLNNLWYRFELRIDNDNAIFRNPAVNKPKSINKTFLKNLKENLERTPLLVETRRLALNDIEYGYFNEQVEYFFDGRKLRHYRG